MSAMSHTPTHTNAVALEPAAEKFAEDTADPPYLFDLGPVEGRKTVDEVQGGDIEKPDVESRTRSFRGDLRVRFRSGSCDRRAPRPLPVVLYVHGAGWVFGNSHTHDRLIRESRTALAPQSCSRTTASRPRPATRPRSRSPTRCSSGSSEHGGEGSQRVSDRDLRRLGGRQHEGRPDADGQAAVGAKAGRAGPLLSGYQRLFRHRLLSGVRGGLLPSSRRNAVVLGPVHDPRGRAGRDHREPAAGHGDQLSGLPPPS